MYWLNLNNAIVSVFERILHNASIPVFVNAAQELTYRLAIGIFCAGEPRVGHIHNLSRLKREYY